MTDNLPLGLNYNSRRVYIEGAEFTSVSNFPAWSRSPPAPATSMSWAFRFAAAIFGMDEDKKESRAAVVNETFARRFYPGQDAIGKRFNFRGPNDPFWEIVGVVPDGKYTIARRRSEAAVYTPFFRELRRHASRSSPAPAAMRTRR